MKVRKKKLLIFIPLLLSAFTHLWNPIGFPSVHVDEGHYIRRALQVLEGVGHQEMASSLNEHRSYDHPYFGQIFLALIFKLVGYPTSIISTDTLLSNVEVLYMIPRIIVGLLALLDTFLVYKIAERRYNTNVAIIASILFAVMPMTLLLRRVLLESILLPFILTPILLAVNYNSIEKTKRANKRNDLLIVFSGIFMGLAIFTKIPSIFAIPLISYLLVRANNKKKWKSLGIWFIPVMIIPAIWPVYAILYDQFDEWLEGVGWQTTRVARSLFYPSESFFEIDPVLVGLGMIGIVYGIIKKDYFFVLWVLPYILLLAFLGYSQYFHMVVLFPVLCLSAANLIYDVSRKLDRWAATRKTVSSSSAVPAQITDFLDSENPQKEIPSLPNPNLTLRFSFIASKAQFLMILTIGVFGLVSTTLLISTDVNSSFYAAYALLIKHLPDKPNENSEGGEDEEKVTVIGPRRWGIYYFWIPKYVFNKDLDFFDYKDVDASETGNTITFREGQPSSSPRGLETHVLLAKVENMAREYDFKKYPFNNMKYNQIPSIDIRANY